MTEKLKAIWDKRPVKMCENCSYYKEYKEKEYLHSIGEYNNSCNSNAIYLNSHCPDCIKGYLFGKQENN